MKWVFIVEFLFAFAPVAIATVLGLQADYEATGAGRAVPYPVLLIIVVTTLQVLTIALALVTWYFPSYRVDQR